MSLKDQIMSDIKEAMKAKQTDRVKTLRFVHSAIKNREIELRPNTIDEQEVLNVLKKSIKQRKESIEQYKNAGRDDLVASEAAELEILETYLPEMLSEDQVKKIVQDAIQETGANSIKQMGQVMKLAIEKSGGLADNKLVSQLVKAELQ